MSINDEIYGAALALLSDEDHALYAALSAQGQWEIYCASYVSDGASVGEAASYIRRALADIRATCTRRSAS